MRHDALTGNVVFETASDSPEQAGSWVVRYSERWDASVPLTSVLFELKAGTWQVESLSPGPVVFDNFRVVRP